MQEYIVLCFKIAESREVTMKAVVNTALCYKPDNDDTNDDSDTKTNIPSYPPYTITWRDLGIGIWVAWRCQPAAAAATECKNGLQREARYPMVTNGKFIMEKNGINLGSNSAVNLKQFII